MKYLIPFFLLISNHCFSQSVLDHFRVEKIKGIEISYSPIMDENPKEGKMVKSSTDSVFMEKIKMMLGKLPADGTCHKDFGKHISTYRIKIIDQNEQPHHLIFFGRKLRSQSQGFPGTFYCGSNVNYRFEKKLYTVIRNFMEEK